VRNRGDFDSAFSGAAKKLEVDYYVPMLAHASMEPPVAVAEFRNGKVEAWCPTQNPQAVQDAVAAALGITPKDVSIAEIYDPFTGICMVHIEDFGLVKKGEIGPWVREGRNRLDGDVPVNTHGGLMSEAHIHGLNHVIEAVQQLRPEGVVDDLCNGAHTFDRTTCRQVRDPKIALVCGECGESAVLLRSA